MEMARRRPALTVTAPSPTSTPLPTARAILREQDAVARVLPSVVRVSVPDGMGSGVILDSNGLIVTNAHVVQGARQAEVRLQDGRTLTGMVEEADERGDLALLRVPEAGLPAAALADVDLLRASPCWPSAMRSTFGVGRPSRGASSRRTGLGRAGWTTSRPTHRSIPATRVGR